VITNKHDDRPTGPDGLIVAVVAMAVNDALSDDAKLARDAWHYLCGATYKHHISWLGLDHFRLPREVLKSGH